MNKTLKNIIMLFILIFLILPRSVKAESLEDIPEDWSRKSLDYCIRNSWLVGYDNKINPDNYLTRAEISTIINRILRLNEKINIDNFKDVKKDKWYYEELEKTAKVEIIKGYDNKLYPEKYITREEAFVMVARLLDLKSDELEHLKFKDGQDVSNWSEKRINALIKYNYINGDGNGYLNIKDNIKRKEFAQLITDVINDYIDKEGTYIKTEKGNVLINKGPVRLKDLKIEGDLIIAEGVEENNIILDNTVVIGRIIIRGKSNLILENGSVVNSLLVFKN